MIELQDISFSYGTVPWITELNAVFKTGKIHGIIGPNGCGKSTVLKLVAGLLKPQQGQILLNGTDMGELSKKARAQKVALLSQHLQNTHLLAQDLVLSGRYPYRGIGISYSEKDKAAATRAMELTGCNQFRDKWLDQLSGGERQRVFLAAALAQQTEILLLDEPTTFLDVQASLELMKLLHRIQAEEAKTVVAVLHDLHLALRYCSTVTVLSRGKIVTAGTPKAVVESGAIPAVFDVGLERFERGGQSFFCFG